MSRDKSQTHQSNVQLRGGALSEGRMPCPDCGTPMVLPIEAMFTGAPIWCGNCGIKLEVNLAESAEALDALRKARERIEQIRKDAAAGR